MTRPNRRLRATILAAALSSAALLAGCSGDSPTELVDSAKALLAKDDARGAIIQLKNALQAKPDLAEARFLLGKAMMTAGDATAATLELRKALELGHPEAEVVPELARAMFVDGQFQRLTEQFGQTALGEPLAQADLKATLAITYGSMGRRAQAQQAVEDSLRAIPDYGPARVFEARLQADTGDLDGALAAVDRQIERTPQNHDAWQLKGDILNYGKRDPDAALAAYRQAIAVKPNFVPAHSAIMTILLGKSDVTAAREQLAKLQAVLPNHPQTTYFAANVALVSKDLDRAQELVQVLLRGAPDNARVLQLAGAVAFERKAFLQAESHLTKALQVAPTQDVSRRLLALTYLQLSQPAKTLSTLQPLLDKPSPGATVYTLAAQAHLQAGELDEAEAAFAKATQLNPKDDRSRTALAVSKVLKGETDTGIAELQRLAATDEGKATADLPLIGALVREKDFAKALVAIDNLEKKQPDKPLAANLRARVLMLQGKRDEAKAQFERALTIQPTFYPARSALAQMALDDGKPEEAQRQLDEALKADPRNIPALLASARFKASQGASRAEISAVFEKAIEAAPTNAAPRLALINFLIAQKDFKGALEAAQQADSRLPNNPDIVEALGRSLASSGDTNQAISTFGKLAQMQPQSPVAYLRIADVQWAARNRDGAMQSLRRALSVAPENLPAQRALIDAYLAENQNDKAIGVAKEIQTQRPTEDVGYLVEGSILGTQKHWDQAVTVYRAGLKAVPQSTQLSSRLHVALMANKQPDLANRHAADWLRDHPKDADFRFYLGDLALARKDLPEAERQYREVLKVNPENPLALNNVAWIMAMGKRQGAVVLAQKAATLLPDRPVIMDTLALSLSSEGRKKEAVEVMRKAVALDEKNPQLRFNLAKLLIEAGDKAAAKTELESLAKLGDKFPRQGDVSAMLKTL